MEIKAPDLGVDSAEVSEIMVNVGDTIAKDDNIILLESDKASVEVPSSAAGKVTKINVNVGDMVSEGMTLIEVESADDSNDSASDETAASKEKVSEKQESNADSSEVTANQKSETTSAPKAENSQAPSAAKSSTHQLPDLGVDEAQVAEVMVSVGDTVDKDEPILLIESDKASVEVPAPEAGIIEKILVNNGDMVANGQDYIIIKSESSSSVEAAPQQDAPATQESKPKLQQTTGEPKQAPAPTSNKAAASTAGGQPQQNVKKLSESEVNAKLTDVYAGPAVRKLARELGVDITQVQGSALNERILKEDLFAYVKTRMTAQTAASVGTGVAVGSGLPSLPDMSNIEIWGETETADLSRLQKVSIPQLNLNTYLPQVTQFDVADITETESLRNELKGDLKKQGIGLTILAFIVKATAYALTQFPSFNSHLSDDNTQLILRKSVNMGIAVATDDGLIVPVIKNAQDKGIKQIAIEIGELAAKARDKKLGAKDLQGASFTISSQGVLGGTAFTPLVNWPQVGILGASEATIQPKWSETSQSFEPRLMLPLSLSYDHRVINGADAAVFTRYVTQLLADPRKILL
ncbi:2-oxo acid dehydrogenase subunit E2 [Psychrobacter ciconiae]|uniref:2-oxo acid dehydrogenase subunit E2 n=1 Tax=Psychrobacter ciconiae TaxID=1553449 RepID=UPI00191A12CD|nr:2-oxo acid dehydrogenase subunit E2 [Psychrobacter ciconiae]